MSFADLTSLVSCPADFVCIVFELGSGNDALIMKHSLSPEERKKFLGRHEELFRDFTGREELLQTITRYKSYPHKLFPTTLRAHQHQVAAFVAYFLNEFPELSQKAGLDEERMIVMAWIHDDNEVDMRHGDIQSASEVHRTKKENEDLLSDIQQSIQCTAARFPEKVGGFLYRELLEDVGMRVDSRESQLVKFCDKMVGFGEALHEIHAGNTTFSTGMIDPNFGR